MLSINTVIVRVQPQDGKWNFTRIEDGQEYTSYGLRV